MAEHMIFGDGGVIRAGIIEVGGLVEGNAKCFTRSTAVHGLLEIDQTSLFNAFHVRHTLVIRSGRVGDLSLAVVTKFVKRGLDKLFLQVT